MTRNRPRLNRDVIIDCALVLARADGKPGEAPTGKSLGMALAVDRSAIWRHFADKDDLLLAIADAMFGEFINDITPPADPIARLRSVWEGALAAFRRYPSVGAQLGSRWISGPNALRISEFVLRALGDLDVPQEALGLEYRAFIDLTLSYGAMVAQHALIPAEVRRHDEIAMEVAIRGRDPEGHPGLVGVVDRLFAIAEEGVPDTIFASYAAGLETRFGAGSSPSTKTGSPIF